MKTKSLIIALIVLFTVNLNAQINKNVYKGNPSVINKTQIKQDVKGIKISDYTNLTSEALSQMKVPLVSPSETKNSPTVQGTWEITPSYPKSDHLSIKSKYYGEYSLESWTLISRPRLEGSDYTGNYTSWLKLKFNQVVGTQYLMKIKLRGTGYRNQSIYVGTNDFTALYPIDSNGIVYVIWTTDRSDAINSIDIGQLAKHAGARLNDANPETAIEKIAISVL